MAAQAESHHLVTFSTKSRADKRVIELDRTTLRQIYLKPHEWLHLKYGIEKLNELLSSNIDFCRRDSQTKLEVTINEINSRRYAERIKFVCHVQFQKSTLFGPNKEQITICVNITAASATQSTISAPSNDTPQTTIIAPVPSQQQPPPTLASQVSTRPPSSSVGSIDGGFRPPPQPPRVPETDYGQDAGGAHAENGVSGMNPPAGQSVIRPAPYGNIPPPTSIGGGRPGGMGDMQQGQGQGQGPPSEPPPPPVNSQMGSHFQRNFKPSVVLQPSDAGFDDVAHTAMEGEGEEEGEEHGTMPGSQQGAPAYYMNLSGPMRQGQMGGGGGVPPPQPQRNYPDEPYDVLEGIPGKGGVPGPGQKPSGPGQVGGPGQIGGSKAGWVQGGQGQMSQSQADWRQQEEQPYESLVRMPTSGPPPRPNYQQQQQPQPDLTSPKYGRQGSQPVGGSVSMYGNQPTQGMDTPNSYAGGVSQISPVLCPSPPVAGIPPQSQYRPPQQQGYGQAGGVSQVGPAQSIYGQPHGGAYQQPSQYGGGPNPNFPPSQIQPMGSQYGGPPPQQQQPQPPVQQGGQGNFQQQGVPFRKSVSTNYPSYREQSAYGGGVGGGQSTYGGGPQSSGSLPPPGRHSVGQGGPNDGVGVMPKQRPSVVAMPSRMDGGGFDGQQQGSQWGWGGGHIEAQSPLVAQNSGGSMMRGDSQFSGYQVQQQQSVMSQMSQFGGMGGQSVSQYMLPQDGSVKVTMDADCIERCSWFLNIPPDLEDPQNKEKRRRLTESLLADKREGAWLVRKHNNGPEYSNDGAYIITMKYMNKALHLKVPYDFERREYVLNGCRFPTMIQLLNYFSVHPISNRIATPLTEAVVCPEDRDAENYVIF